MPAHIVDGFGLQFTSRTSWKANVFKGKQLVAVAPVTWTKGYRRNPTGDGYLSEVWYANLADLKAALTSQEAFIVAMAEAKDYSVLPHQFKYFTAIFEVVSTGKQLTNISIETTVQRRLKAGDIDA